MPLMADNAARSKLNLQMEYKVSFKRDIQGLCLSVYPVLSGVVPAGKGMPTKCISVFHVAIAEFKQKLFMFQVGFNTNALRWCLISLRTLYLCIEKAINLLTCKFRNRT